MKIDFTRNRLRTLIWYDLNYGYQSTRLKWLGAVLVQTYFAIMAYQGCSVFEMPAGVPGYLGYLFRGMPEYFLSETGKFELPVPWLILQAYLLFLTSSYPAEDLARSGGQAFVRASRRRDWLFGKGAWVACTVAAYYLLLSAVLALCALATGGIGGEPGFLDSLLGMEPGTLEGMGGAEVFLRWWSQLFLVSLTLCMTEMVLSLVWEPAMALFLMLGYLTASVFWASPAFLGNFSMLLRQNFLSGIPGIDLRNCVMICAAWNGAALWMGARWIRQKDIF